MNAHIEQMLIEKLKQLPPERIAEVEDFVDFLHPWGGVWRDPLALLLMFFGLVIGSILILRAQDIG